MPLSIAIHNIARQQQRQHQSRQLSAMGAESLATDVFARPEAIKCLSLQNAVGQWIVTTLDLAIDHGVQRDHPQWYETQVVDPRGDERVYRRYGTMGQTRAGHQHVVRLLRTVLDGHSGCDDGLIGFVLEQALDGGDEPSEGDISSERPLGIQ